MTLVTLCNIFLKCVLFHWWDITKSYFFSIYYLAVDKFVFTRMLHLQFPTDHCGIFLIFQMLEKLHRAAVTSHHWWNTLSSCIHTGLSSLDLAWARGGKFSVLTLLVCCLCVSDFQVPHVVCKSLVHVLRKLKRKLSFVQHKIPLTIQEDNTALM